MIQDFDLIKKEQNDLIINFTINGILKAKLQLESLEKMISETHFQIIVTKNHYKRFNNKVLGNKSFIEMDTLENTALLLRQEFVSLKSDLENFMKLNEKADNLKNEVTLTEQIQNAFINSLEKNDIDLLMFSKKEINEIYKNAQKIHENVGSIKSKMKNNVLKTNAEIVAFQSYVSLEKIIALANYVERMFLEAVYSNKIKVQEYQSLGLSLDEIVNLCEEVPLKLNDTINGNGKNMFDTDTCVKNLGGNVLPMNLKLLGEYGSELIEENNSLAIGKETNYNDVFFDKLIPIVMGCIFSFGMIIFGLHYWFKRKKKITRSKSKVIEF